MIEQPLFQFLMDRLSPGWRERAAKRKTAWNLFKVLIWIPLLAGSWVLLTILMWQVFLLIHPEYSGPLSNVIPNERDGYPVAPRVALLLPLMIPAIGISFILTNLVLWCIPPARRAFERESGGDPAMTFRGANRSLGRATLYYLAPIGCGLSLLSAIVLGWRA
jgi:hypothetical protein